MAPYDPNDPNDPFLVTRILLTAFFDAKHAAYNTVYRVVGSNLRADYEVRNGRQVFSTDFHETAPINSLADAGKEVLNTGLDMLAVNPVSKDASSLLSKVTNKASLARETGEIVDAVHGNSKLSQKAQHGYEIFDESSGKVLEYGISGQTRTANQVAEGASPRITQKLRTKYGNDPNIKGRVVERSLGNRSEALSWEQNQVDLYNLLYGAPPRYQFKPTPSGQ